MILEPRRIKSVTASTFSPSICYELMGPDAMILAFFIVQLSHPYITTGKTVALARQTFIGKAMSLLFNMLSMLVIAFLSRSKHLLISWLKSSSQ